MPDNALVDSGGDIKSIMANRAALRQEQAKQGDDEVPAETLEEEVTPEEESQELAADESEEPAEDEESQPASEDSEEEFFLINGEEIALKTVLGWKEGDLRQSDYTKKTQGAAATVKKAEEAQARAEQLAEELESMLANIGDEFLKSDDGDESDDDLRDIDPSAYLKRKEDRERKQKLLASARSKAKKLKDDAIETTAVEEQKKLFAANSDWLDSNGRPTKKAQSDADMMERYLVDEGLTNEEIKSISTAREWMQIKKLAEAKITKGKTSEFAKKVKKAPKVTKPGPRGSPSKTASSKKLEAAMAKAKASGDVKDITAVRKLRRELNSR